MLTKQSFAMFAILNLSGGFAHATVEPTVESLSQRSHLIVLGKVVAVDNPKARVRRITIQPSRYIKGTFGYVSKHDLLTFTYISDDKVNIDFVQKRNESKEHVFYLIFVSDRETAKTGNHKKPNHRTFHLQFTDSWFGVYASEAELIRTIERLVDAENEVYKRSNANP